MGSRRDVVGARPRGKVIEQLPQWVCEVLSEDSRKDLVRKKRIYHRHHVAHDWVLDPEQGTLAVCRWHADGYLAVLSAEQSEGGAASDCISATRERAPNVGTAIRRPRRRAPL